LSGVFNFKEVDLLICDTQTQSLEQSREEISMEKYDQLTFAFKGLKPTNETNNGEN